MCINKYRVHVPNPVTRRDPDVVDHVFAQATGGGDGVGPLRHGGHFHFPFVGQRVPGLKIRHEVPFDFEVGNGVATDVPRQIKGLPKKEKTFELIDVL